MKIITRVLFIFQITFTKTDIKKKGKLKTFIIPQIKFS